MLEKLEKQYIGSSDWKVLENANSNMSYAHFLGYVLDKVMNNYDVLIKYLPPVAVDFHIRGHIHIHKLPHSLWIPYCAGWNMDRILLEGLKTPTIYSKPAKHFDTAISQLITFFYLMAQEWTGAQAVSFIDNHVAPFIAKDKLDDHSIRQVVQRLLYELNYPSRTGYQSPFTNITLGIDTLKTPLSKFAIIGGKLVNSRLADYIDETIRFDTILFKEYIRGDAKGQPFTFPIPTLYITENFDWNGRRWGELTDVIFEALAKRGVVYIMNGLATNVEHLYAMCCRLTIDMSRVSPHGMWATPDATGSIGVVTINLPRLAYMSNGEWDKFEEFLRLICTVIRDVLNVYRSRYIKNLEKGLMPMSKEYLVGKFTHHYSTIGVIGLPEAVANFMGDPKLWIDGSTSDMRRAVDLMRKMVRLIKDIAVEFWKEDNVPWNVEEVPGESTSYRLASLDYKLYKDDIEKGKMFIPTVGGVPFYSNSIIPYYVDIPVHLRAEWEGIVQQEFTGGVMMHIFLGEYPEPDILKKFVYRLVHSTKVVYFSITPTISVCNECDWYGVGIYDVCPKCGSKRIDVWSRIVGYYRPVRNWNIGKIAEFKSRKLYSF